MVALHTIPKDLSIGTRAIYYLAGAAIPLFFLSSGYFLLNRGEISLQYSARKILGILRIVVLWNLAFYALQLLWKAVHAEALSLSIGDLIQSVFQSLIQKGEMWHFWYLGALMLIYALLPFLSRLIAAKGYKGLLPLLLTVSVGL